MCSSHHQDHSAFIDATPLQYTSALAALGRMSRWQQVLSSLKCLLFGLFVPETDGNILEPGFAFGWSRRGPQARRATSQHFLDGSLSLPTAFDDSWLTWAKSNPLMVLGMVTPIFSIAGAALAGLWLETSCCFFW